MLHRRGFFAAGAALATAAALPIRATRAAAEPAKRTADEPFGYCLNSSTIRGQKLPIDKIADLAAEVGYHALEPWVSELETYEKGGGSLKDLGKRIRDLGLTVESVIAFPNWIVDNDEARAKGLELAKRNMETALAIGGKRLACPPAGATEKSDMNLGTIAQRYRALCEVGDQVGVQAELEVWGFSKTLGRLSEAAHVAMECGHPKACLLADVYHLYKGGSDFQGIRLLSGESMHVIHMNDYPDLPPRDKIKDEDRIYPGDGVAPLKTLFRNLKAIGYHGYLSLELFNRRYWEQDAKLVMKTALEKTRVAVRSAWDT